MKWRGRQGSSNIDDRRGQGGFNPMGGAGGSNMRFRIPSGGGGRGGAGGIGIIVVVVIIAMALGFNPLELLNGQVTPQTGSQPVNTPAQRAGDDEMAQFVGVVVQDTEDFWTEVFAQNRLTYKKPVIVLFSGSTSSACGLAQSATGPFYCPNDNKVYIDLSFYDQLRRQFGAPGDFAQAYVLAHEVGHHVQNLTGVLPEFNQRRARMSESEANAYSVRVELQADCYAGLWANYAKQQGFLESGDIDEALNAAAQIGDDTLQKKSQGFAVPDSFNHGTSAQRVKWFRTGYSTGDAGACDTFSVANP